VPGSRSRNPNLLRRSTVTASGTAGRALRYAKGSARGLLLHHHRGHSPCLRGRYGGLGWASHILSSFAHGEAFVEEGHSHRSAAARFRVSVQVVNDMVIPKRETGGLQSRRRGNSGHGKLEPLRAWLQAGMALDRATRRAPIRWRSWQTGTASRSIASRPGGFSSASA
ncbi:MAG: hypothetical protein ACXIUV_03700, partial [Alkalilacustris sp.]